jgi:hypothetical protein
MFELKIWIKLNFQFFVNSKSEKSRKELFGLRGRQIDQFD